MPFKLNFTESASAELQEIKTAAKSAYDKRVATKKKKKAAKQEGLLKQINTTLNFLKANPKHPSLNTHKFSSITNPIDAKQPVFEAYAQNKTPSAYRVFWCYGPNKSNITIIAITPHP